MRPTPMLLALFLSQLSLAVVPHTLTSGSPAKASDVNDNFNYLDSTVQKKASQSTVDVLSSAINAKADGSLRDSLKTRVDTGSFSAFKAKEAGDISSLNATKADISIKDSLKARVDTGSFSTLKANVASLNATIANTPTTASLKLIRDTVSLIQTSVSALQSGKADASLKDSLKARVDTGSFSAFKATEAGDISALKAQVLGLPTSGSLNAIRDTLGRKVDTSAVRQLRDTVRTKVDANWVNSAITGKLPTGTLLASYNLKDLTNADTARKNLGLGALATRNSITSSDVTTAIGFTPAVNAGDQGKGIFDNPNPPVGSWAFECNCGEDNSTTAPLSSANIQVFSTGSAYRGFQIATDYWTDKYFLRRGANVWQSWVQIVHSGNFKDMATANGIVMNTGGTITGDLRISGKLTTNPGATPADYVFEPDYKLSSLSEIEAYTKANKHLPEVPSASEMTEKGVDIAAMNMVLLKKVEELTLHAIEQQKQAEVAAKKMDMQEKNMAELKAGLEVQQHMIDELKTAGAKR